jgi:hypothetical protein
MARLWGARWTGRAGERQGDRSRGGWLWGCSLGSARGLLGELGMSCPVLPLLALCYEMNVRKETVRRKEKKKKRKVKKRKEKRGKIWKFFQT